MLTQISLEEVPELFELDAVIEVPEQFVREVERHRHVSRVAGYVEHLESRNYDS